MLRPLFLGQIVSIIMLITIAPMLAVGADDSQKPLQERVTVPARMAPVYGFPVPTGSEYTAPPAPPERNLNGAKAGEGIIETIGETTYDIQHHCTMARQIEHRANYSMPFTPYGHYIHFDWTAKAGAIPGVGRGIGYQAYEIATCSHRFMLGGIRIEGDFAGYVGMDAHNLDATNSWAVPMAHEIDLGVHYSKAYWDFTAGGPVFGVFTSDFSLDCYGWYQNIGTGPGNENNWPVHDWDIDGEEFVLHLVTSEAGGAPGDPLTCSYYRRVGPYGTGNGVWSDQRVIDVVMNYNVTVASSPISDKVAIVWNAPVDYKRNTPNEFDNQYENDVWFAIEDDNGAAWAGNPTSLGNPSIGSTVDLGVGNGYNWIGGNLTTYDPMSDWKAFCDMSALWYIDGVEDYLQIVWGCRRWTDTTSIYRRQSAIFHWNQWTDQIRSIVKATWDVGGACYAHTWGGDAAKMTISQCLDRLYVCYTQFGDENNPCHFFDANDNIVAGLLHIAVYDPFFDAWDRPQQVTTVINPTPCVPGNMAGPGTCNSEYWSSMARYGRIDTCKVDYPEDVLDILYVNDYAPGDCVHGAAVFTINPVNWTVYPCREAVPEPRYDDDAGPGYGLSVGQPILVLGTTDDTTFTLTMENNGIIDNTPVSISITGGSPKSTVTATPNTGITIPAIGGQVPVEINIITTGETNNSTVIWALKVTHQAGDAPPTDRVIPICLTVSDSYVPLESAVIATECKRLRVYNNGQLSNESPNESMDYIDDPDDCANIYLSDGSPIICREDDGTKRCYFSIFDNNYANDHALRQVSPIYYDSVFNPDYEYAASEFITGDSAIGLIAEYFTPKAGEYCCFIVEKLRFWNRTESTLTHVRVGEAVDWDIPSDESEANNESGWDNDRKLIYQSCDCPGYFDPCETSEPCQRYGGIASYGDDPAFKNYQTLENDVYVYFSGPFGEEAPLPDEQMYDLMNLDGPILAVIPDCEDLMTLVTFGVYDLEPNDTICVIKILTTSKMDPGGVQLRQNVDDANDFIDAHDEIKCENAGPCECIPGDANNDGSVNVGDAVYLISYIFKGGPPPVPYTTCSGDANMDCSCNVGDAVYIINYVFKEGPPPPECDDWVEECGWYE